MHSYINIFEIAQCQKANNTNRITHLFISIEQSSSYTNNGLISLITYEIQKPAVKSLEREDIENLLHLKRQRFFYVTPNERTNINEVHVFCSALSKKSLFVYFFFPTTTTTVDRYSINESDFFGNCRVCSVLFSDDIDDGRLRRISWLGLRWIKLHRKKISYVGNFSKDALRVHDFRIGFTEKFRKRILLR